MTTNLWRTTRIVNRRQKTVYVIGHRNPDADSVIAAEAYAALKRAMGMGNCVAARAGKITPQTEYIFSRFKVPLPEFLPELLPKVAYYYNPQTETVTSDMSLWKAMSLLQNNENRALPIVDRDGRYHSLLHYSLFAQRLLQVSNPRQKTAIQTSIDLLASVLDAQVLVAKNGDEIKKSPIIVAAAQFDTFCEILGTHIPENTIVISGNRRDVQEHSIESGVRALIITNGDMLEKKLRERADEKGVSVLISPYDTSSTTLLSIYSMPVARVSNTELKPIGVNETVRKAVPLLSEAPGKALPVVDADDRVVGVVSESDLYHEPNVEIIMVDHNELSQAIEGIENYRILQIIDHHRLGSITTRNPITFINKPVGATSTIIATLYQENRVPLTVPMASILLCGILADTLVLQSATTTDTDRQTAQYLADIANLEIDELGPALMAAASNVAGRGAVELLGQDMKEYEDREQRFTVSQIEVGNPREIIARKDEFVAALEAARAKAGALFSSLLVTDITNLTSLLLVAADPKFVPYITLPRLEDSVYIMRDMVSRKKQVIPILSELVEKYADLH